VYASCIDWRAAARSRAFNSQGLKALFLSTPAGNTRFPPGAWCSLFFPKVNAMKEGDASAFHPAVPCALLSGRTAGKMRVWGFWSRLRWHLLG
jgi:hypothetical protein